MRRLALALIAALPASGAEDFASKAAALEGKKDAKAWLALADWAGDRLLLEERGKALKAVLGFDPENARAHDLLDEKKWEGAWLPADEAEAREIEANGAKGLIYYGSKWLPEKEADKLRTADVQAILFSPRNRIDTPHVRLFSKCTLPQALKLAWTLEHVVEPFARLHQDVWPLKTKFKELQVLAFSDPEDFRLFQKKLVERKLVERECPPEEFTSTFTTSGSLLLFMDGIDRDERAAFRTVMPGAAAQVVTALCMRMAGLDTAKQVPPWAATGLGYLFGYGVVGRQVLPGAPGDFCGDGVLFQLEQGLGKLNLKDLTSIADPVAFQQTDGSFRLAESWAFAGFLLHGEGGRHAAGFRKYLSGLPGKGSLKELEAKVAKVSDLEEPFRKYVAEDLLPRAKAALKK